MISARELSNRWRGQRSSANTEDRHRSGGSPRRGLHRAGGLDGLAAVAIIVVGMLLGINTSFLIGCSGGGLPNDVSYQAQPGQIDDAAEEFVSVRLADKSVGRKFGIMPPT